MRLRAKIFLLVGGLFLFAFIASQVLEEYLTSKNLRFEGELLHQKVLETQEAARLNLVRYSKSLIDHRNSQIDVLFNKMQQFEWLRQRFSPSLKNYDNQTWLSSASLVFENKWIDFIENTNEGKIVSQIVLDSHNPSLSIQVPQNKDFSYVLVRDKLDDTRWHSPYIGIPFRLDTVNLDPDTTIEGNEGFKTTASEFYFIFKPQTILNYDVEELLSKVKGLTYADFPGQIHLDEADIYKQTLLELITSMGAAKDYLKANPQKMKELQSSELPAWLVSEIPDLDTKCSMSSKELSSLSSEAWLSLRFDKISMLWQISGLLGTETLAKDPFSTDFPIGMAQAPSSQRCGQALLNRQIFYDKSSITSRSTLTIPSLYGAPNLYTRVVFKDGEDRLFFGTMMELKNQSKKGVARQGSVTIGVDAREVVRNIALATSTQTFFVSNNQVLTGFDSLGELLSTSELQIPLARMGKANSGFFEQNGIDYFFMKLEPYQGLGLSFYLITPRDEKFALSESISENAQSLIRKITIQMQFIAMAALVIVLFVLNHIAKHVTHPITHLARACRTLRDGHLEEVKLPKLDSKGKDEIHTLYFAFDEMIRGLKEKDKVQGVLNKVVSPTIANEILSGNIHLGGEEKVVTVLFADIRSFTKMTEKMPPHVLIDMLNTCMTKISNTIDAHGGVIDKYVGDEVMALFGAPIEDPDSSYKAVQCAFDILRVLDDWNAQRTKEHLQIIEMGIGIHTGNMIVGNMGAENRLNYTVLGANVNLASRLCAVALPSQILISHTTLENPNVQAKFETRPLEKMMLKGFSEPIDTYEVLRPLEDD